MKYDIISIGSAVRDVFIIEKDFRLLRNKLFSTGVGQCLAFGSKIEVDKIVFDTGGGGTNTATTFAHMGLKTGIFTRVGDDENGAIIIKALKKENIDTKWIQRVHNGITGYSTILSQHFGDRTVLVYRGVSAFFKTCDIPLAQVDTKWICLSSLGGNIKLLQHILFFVKKKNISLAFLPGEDELKNRKWILKYFLPFVKIICLNREEAATLLHISSNSIHFHLSLFAKYFHGKVCMTDGSKGAWLFDAATMTTYFGHAYGPRAVNALGAGDAFASGFVAGIQKTKNDVLSFRLALLNSGSVVGFIGAKNGLLQKFPSTKKLAQIKIKKYHE